MIKTYMDGLNTILDIFKIRISYQRKICKVDENVKISKLVFPIPYKKKN